MTLHEVFFINHLPTLDLHGYDRDSARVAICDFIKENQKLKNPMVVIIHGAGSGILRNETKETLKRSSIVQDYKLANFNNGCTIAQIKV